MLFDVYVLNTYLLPSTTFTRRRVVKSSRDLDFCDPNAAVPPATTDTCTRARLHNVYRFARVSDSTRTAQWLQYPWVYASAHACCFILKCDNDINIVMILYYRVLFFFAGICAERKELSSVKRGNVDSRRPRRPRKRVRENRFDDGASNQVPLYARSRKRYNPITVSIVRQRRTRCHAPITGRDVYDNNIIIARPMR